MRLFAPCFLSKKKVILKIFCWYILENVWVIVWVAGYRHVSLRNELNQPQGLATLFVHIKVKDYIIDAFAGWLLLCYRVDSSVILIFSPAVISSITSNMMSMHRNNIIVL